jgi:hypothetical protein
MARQALVVQRCTAAGLEPTYSAASVDGHAAINDGRTVLHVKNGDAASVTVTIQTPYQRDGLDLAERTVEVPAGEDRFIGPFARRIYNQSGTDAGKIYVDYSGVTSVTVAALQVI